MWGNTKFRQENKQWNYINNTGEKIGSLDIAVSNDKVVTVNLLNGVGTNVTLRDWKTGKVTTTAVKEPPQNEERQEQKRPDA
jgi:hypothetical protein